MSAQAIELALAHIKERCFSDGSLNDFYHSHRSLTPEKEQRALRKLRADSETFERRANAEQRQQVKKLWRFRQAAKYGPALGTSWKRTRRAYLFDALWKIISSLEPPPGFPSPDLPKATKALTAILKAAQKDGESWADFAIAAKLRKTRSQVNWFLAEYSWLMLGKPPALTFGELQKILHWIKPTDLRKKIRNLRKTYGELVVPLKRGQVGRPRKNRG